MVLLATCQSKEQIKSYQQKIFLAKKLIFTTAKGTLSSLIEYQNTLQATETSRLRWRCFCYRRVRYLFWWVCVSWRCFYMSG